MNKNGPSWDYCTFKVGGQIDKLEGLNNSVFGLLIYLLKYVQLKKF